MEERDDLDKLLKSPEFLRKLAVKGRRKDFWVRFLLCWGRRGEFPGEEEVQNYLSALEDLSLAEVMWASSFCIMAGLLPEPEELRKVGRGLPKLAPTIALSLLSDPEALLGGCQLTQGGEQWAMP